MLKNLLSNRIFIGILVLIVCGVVSVYFLRTDLPEEPIKIYTPVEPTPKPKAETPIGETERGRHVHEDGTWHAEADANAEDTIALRNDESFSPVPWSNPLMPEEIPEHLKMPLEWINWDYQALSEEKKPNSLLRTRKSYKDPHNSCHRKLQSQTSY